MGVLLILAAFLVGGTLRIPASLLGLSGVLPVAGPTRYVLLQARLGLVRVAIGILMLRGFRRSLGLVLRHNRRSTSGGVSAWRNR